MGNSFGNNPEKVIKAFSKYGDAKFHSVTDVPNLFMISLKHKSPIIFTAESADILPLKFNIFSARLDIVELIESSVTWNFNENFLQKEKEEYMSSKWALEIKGEELEKIYKNLETILEFIFTTEFKLERTVVPYDLQ